MAIEWTRPKDPAEVIDYGHDWTPDLGDDTIATSVWSAISASGTAQVTSSHTDTIARLFLSGGTDGETALWRNVITTADGRTIDEVFQLRVVEKATVSATGGRLEALQADRAAIYAAKVQFLTGGQVKQVTRDGRTLVFNTTSSGEFDRALAQIDADIAALDATCTGRRRRRALSVAFG